MDEFDQIEGEYFDRIQARRAPAQASQQAYPLAPVPMPVQSSPVPAIPLYDISLAQAPEQPPQESMITRRVAGLPVWGWGLIGTAALGAGWYLWKQGKVAPNPPAPVPVEPRIPATNEEWSPSRSRFGESLGSWMSHRSIPSRDVTVYTDADEAKRHIKPVSPLVTIKCSASVKMPMEELQGFCSEEGLLATDHGEGVIGFYPSETNPRGREWESYIDALRDEGQTV